MPIERVPMGQPLSSPEMTSSALPSGRAATVIAWAGAGFGVVAVLAALALWFHYGTAVFFEMIASGISACF